MTLGTTAIGITTIVHGSTAGMIPGTTDGMTHGTLGDGLTTDITAGTRHIITADTTTHTTVEVAADVIMPTEALVMRVREMCIAEPAAGPLIATPWPTTASVWAA